jgi:hypothetical protein
MDQDAEPTIEDKIDRVREELRLITCILADHELQIGDLVKLKRELYALISLMSVSDGERPSN